MRYRMKPRHVIASVIICTLLVLFWRISVFHSTGKQQLDRRLAELREQGYPTTLAELEAYDRLPEGADNAAPLYLQALADYTECIIDLPLFERDLPLAAQALDPMDVQLIQDILEDFNDVLVPLHQAVDIKHCCYPRDPNTGLTVIHDQLLDLQKLVLLLSLEAHWHADHNDAPAAYESLRASIVLTQSLDAPLVLYHLVMNIHKVATIRSLQRVLNRTVLSDQSLVDISRSLAAWQASDGLARTWAGERCMVLAPLQRKTSGSFVLSLCDWLGLLSRHIIEYIDLMQGPIDIARLPAHQQLAAAQKHDEASKALRSPLLRRIVPKFSGQFKRNLISVAHARLAYTALAIERYRLATGHWPATLDALSPQYLPSVPLDPFDGLALRYEKQSLGFRVFSLGPEKGDEIAFDVEREQKQ